MNTSVFLARLIGPVMLVIGLAVFANQRAFRLAVEAGRAAHEAGLMQARDFASPSTPVIGTPFWHAVS